jgi:hypothetical protein
MQDFVDGDRVVYYPKQGESEFGVILRTHRDDEIPYYTILLDSNIEKQTDASHLILIPDIDNEDKTDDVVVSSVTQNTNEITISPSQPSNNTSCVSQQPHSFMKYIPIHYGFIPAFFTIGIGCFMGVDKNPTIGALAFTFSWCPVIVRRIFS